MKEPMILAQYHDGSIVKEDIAAIADLAVNWSEPLPDWIYRLNTDGTWTNMSDALEEACKEQREAIREEAIHRRAHGPSL